MGGGGSAGGAFPVEQNSSSLNLRKNQNSIKLNNLGKAKVSDVRNHVLPKKNVAGLEITVAMTSCCRFPMLAGSGPSKLLLSRESLCSCVMFPSEDGMIPDNRLFSSVKYCSVLSLPMLSGIGPLKRLLERSNLISLRKLLIPSGILPEMLLNPISRSSSCADRLVIEFGSAPPSLLFCIVTARSLVQFVKNVMNLQSLTLVAFSWFLCSIRYFRQSIPISGGTIPVKLLEERSMERMLVAFAIEAGMLPVKWFKATMKYWIFGRPLPKSEGNLPCNSFSCRPMWISEERLRSVIGMVPDR
uniref:Uncharacterized protein n=1 Tax=Oryza punctata TaxID=4537 RepID=A0A0E0M722_ORYPU